jgi:predicted RNA-binding protein with RPS1 domain
MRILNATEVADWVRDELLNAERERPIVAVTTRPHDGKSWVDPRALDEAIGTTADVVYLETGDATWALADSLPPRLDAYGGAIRVWWPGLTVGSNPYDHKLYFVRSPADARATFEDVVTAVRAFAESDAEPPAEVDAVVTSIQVGQVELEAGDIHGPLRHGDVPLDDLVRCLEVGTKLRARPVRNVLSGSAEFSVKGLLPVPWDLVAAQLSVGDVVVGRVQNVVDYGAFIDILPKVAGLAHKSEIDWTFVDDVARFVGVGQLVPVQIVRIDAAEKRMELSIKRAMGAEPRALPSLVPSGKPFEWEGSMVRAPTPAAEDDDLEERIGEQSQELDALAADRGRLAEQNKLLREQNQALRKELRSLEDKLERLERRVAIESDPLVDERAFVRAVRTTYARMLDEDDRLRHPLLRMRVGPQFLESMRALEGADVEKVLEVCAQVAADFAHEFASREVHQLRAGRAGQPRLRASDDAQAWRCALQVKSPSARRLHWWRIPNASGATIEFASADVHDEFQIPE